MNLRTGHFVQLNTIRLFFWGYVKSHVYVDKPESLEHLEANIRRVIAEIQPAVRQRVCENWTSRLRNVRASRKDHMLIKIFRCKCQKIIFKIKQKTLILQTTRNLV